MSFYRRPRISGATVFFTVALAQRGGWLLVDEVTRLRAAVRQTKTERPFHIDAWVVLPDHLHAVWTLPAGDADFSTRWGAIKARFTRSLRDDCRVGFHPTNAKALGHEVGWNPTLPRSESKVRKGDAGIWQRRFWEQHIRDEADYRAHVRYCWSARRLGNGPGDRFSRKRAEPPVKHGLVNRPEDWPYSSVHRDARFQKGMDLVL